MAFLYVYSPSDFVTGLPNESGSNAAGSRPFPLTLKPGAVPTLIEVTDNESKFDELDTTQELTNAVDIDGMTLAAGTSIHTAYDLINTTTGHKVTSLHFGGDGYEQGAVHGLVSTVELVPGTVYTFNINRSSVNQENYYDDYVACFTAGTRIATQRGLVNVECLRVGDLLETADHGFQPLRLVLHRQISSEELHAKPNLLPVLISQGALGMGLPVRDLQVSPQHRFVANSPIVARMFDQAEVLVAAKKLTALSGIYVDKNVEDVTYFHLVMDRHEILFAENAPTESFYSGPMAIAGLSAEARDEMEAIFPELLDVETPPCAVREMPSSKLQRKLVERHYRNEKPVFFAAEWFPNTMAKAS